MEYYRQTADYVRRGSGEIKAPTSVKKNNSPQPSIKPKLYK